jgi:hypothetical protein
MSKSYSFTDEQAAYIAKMAKTRGIDEKEAAQNLMDKGISRDKALSKYSGSDGKPKAKTPKAKAAPKAKAKGKAKATPKAKAAPKKAAKKARAKIAAPKEASKPNGAAHDEQDIVEEISFEA